MRPSGPLPMHVGKVVQSVSLQPINDEMHTQDSGFCRQKEPLVRTTVSHSHGWHRAHLRSRSWHVTQKKAVLSRQREVNKLWVKMSDKKSSNEIRVSGSSGMSSEYRPKDLLPARTRPLPLPPRPARIICPLDDSRHTHVKEGRRWREVV